jgi:hypothetical protein
MSTITGLLNVALGTVYFSYGLMTIVDLKRGWRSHGFSHFGSAWLAMAFTCGPHHLDHGAHILLSGRAGGPLDLISIGMAAPAGVIWFLLRAEAMLGGRGDRHVSGTPLWMDLLPVAGVVYLAALLNAVLDVGRGTVGFDAKVLPNLLLIALYSAIGAQLARTQLRNRPHTGGWSVSGTSLATVMFTCALMHGVYALYATTGRYDLDVHGYVIDILSVPAAAYFLWVVWALHRGALRDWNDSGDVDAGRRSTRGVTPDPALPELIGAR